MTAYCFSRYDLSFFINYYFNIYSSGGSDCIRSRRIGWFYEIQRLTIHDSNTNQVYGFCNF